MDNNPNYDAALEGEHDREPEARPGMFDDFSEDDFGAPEPPRSFRPAPPSDFEEDDEGEDFSGDDHLSRALAAAPASPQDAPRRPSTGIDPDFLKQVRGTLNPNQGRQKTREEKIEESAERGALEYSCSPQGPDGVPLKKEKVVLWGNYRDSQLHAELLRRRPSLRCAWLVKISTMSYDTKGELHYKPIETRVVRTDAQYIGEDDPATGFDSDGDDGDDDYEEDYGMVEPYEQPASDDDVTIPTRGNGHGNGRVDNTPVLVMRDMFKEQMDLMRELMARGRQEEMRPQADPMEQLDRMSQIMSRMMPQGGAGGGNMEDAIRVVGDVFDKGMNSAKAAERPGMMDMLMLPLMMMAAPMMMNTPMFQQMMKNMGGGGMAGMLPGAGATPPQPDPNAPPLPTVPQPNALPGPTPAAQPQQPAPTTPQPTREQMAHRFRHNFLYQQLNHLVGTGNTRYQEEEWWADKMVFHAEPMANEDLLKMDPAVLSRESLAACPNIRQLVISKLPEEVQGDEAQAASYAEAGMTEWWTRFQQLLRAALTPQPPQTPPSPTPPNPDAGQDGNSSEPPPENPINE